MLELKKRASIEKKIESKLEIIEKYINQGVSIRNIYEIYISKKLNLQINDKYFYRVLKKLREKPKKTEKTKEIPTLKEKEIQAKPVFLSNTAEIALVQKEAQQLPNAESKPNKSLYLTDKAVKYEENYKEIYGKYHWFDKYLSVDEIRQVRNELVEEIPKNEQIEKYKKAIEHSKKMDLTASQAYVKLFFEKYPIKELGEKSFNDMAMQARANRFLLSAEKLINQD